MVAESEQEMKVCSERYTTDSASTGVADFEARNADDQSIEDFLKAIQARRERRRALASAEKERLFDKAKKELLEPEKALSAREQVVRLLTVSATQGGANLARPVYAAVGAAGNRQSSGSQTEPVLSECQTMGLLLQTGGATVRDRRRFSSECNLGMETDASLAALPAPVQCQSVITSPAIVCASPAVWVEEVNEMATLASVSTALEQSE